MKILYVKPLFNFYGEGPDLKKEYTIMDPKAVAPLLQLLLPKVINYVALMLMTKATTDNNTS